jgi:hypothetical protein
MLRCVMLQGRGSISTSTSISIIYNLYVILEPKILYHFFTHLLLTTFLLHKVHSRPVFHMYQTHHWCSYELEQLMSSDGDTESDFKTYWATLFILHVTWTHGVLI